MCKSNKESTFHMVYDVLCCNAVARHGGDVSTIVCAYQPALGAFAAVEFHRWKVKGHIPRSRGAPWRVYHELVTSPCGQITNYYCPNSCVLFLKGVKWGQRSRSAPSRIGHELQTRSKNKWSHLTDKSSANTP